jgi:hypothetical protein
MARAHTVTTDGRTVSRDSVIAAASAARDGSTVRVADPDDPRWDEFVAAQPHARVFQLAAWPQILARAYRFEPIHLVLEDRHGDLRGVLPAVHKSGPLSGSRLASLPALLPGGPLAATDDEGAALLSAACRLAEARGAALRVLSQNGSYAQRVPAVRAAARAPAWIIDLPTDAEELRRRWKKQSNVARNLRKAEASALTVREGRGDEDLRAFHTIYLRTMKRHCAIPHSCAFFEESRDLLAPAGAFRLLLVESNGRAVSGCIAFGAAGRRSGDMLEPHFIANDPRFLGLGPSYALHWALVRTAIAAGFRRLNLGVTTSGESQAAFKAQWGAEPCDEFEYVPAGAQPSRRTGRRALAAWHSRLSTTAWRRAPLPATRAAGQLIYRYL